VSSSGVVVLDLGEVLVPSSAVLPAVAQKLGVAVDDLAVPYWAQRRAYDLGGDDRGYWESVLTGVARPHDAGLVDELSRLDAAGWATLPASGQALLDELVDVRLGLLSNAPAALAAAVRAAPWSRAFDVMVFSAEARLAKPDPRIYAHADAMLGVASNQVVFFDDREENVSGATTHGWDAHLWVDGMTGADVVAAVRARKR
jgi:putative hydrolase of the HAD superfamily